MAKAMIKVRRQPAVRKFSIRFYLAVGLMIAGTLITLWELAKW